MTHSSLKSDDIHIFCILVILIWSIWSQMPLHLLQNKRRNLNEVKHLKLFIKIFWKTYCYLPKCFELWKITLPYKHVFLDQLFIFLTFPMVRLLILEMWCGISDVESLINKFSSLIMYVPSIVYVSSFELFFT